MIAQNQRRKRQPLGLLACLLTAAAAAACAQVAQAHAPATDLVQVATTSGLVQGFRAKLQQPQQQQHANQSVFKFLSVPYAQAPVGALRFQRPRALLGANGPDATLVDATRFAKTCPQFRHLARFISPLLNLDHEHQTSEDCLRLSIYVPSSVMAGEGHQWNASGAPQPLKPSKLLPVIVWIPGEGFDFADERQFDGSQLAQHTQSIVVSVQYRVGILGFLAGAGPNGTRNMGAHDQLAALQWLNRNINAFGGDEQRVTLMGRFSGSMIISTLLTAPQRQLASGDSGEPLFQRAILLSGLAVKDWIIEEQAQQEARVERVLEEALKRGYCKRAHLAGCLRELPVEQLVEISGHGWKLVVDDELVGRLDPIEALREQPQRLAPGVEAVLLGETETEGTLCLYRHLLSQQQSDYARLIEEDRLTSDDLFEMIRDDSSTYFKYNFSRANPIQAALEALTTGGEGELAGPSSAQLREKYLEACSAYMVKAHNGRFKRHLQARNRLLAGSVRAKPVDVFHYSLRYKPSFSLAPDYIQTAAHGDDVPLIFGLIYNQQQQQQQQSIDQADLLMTQKMMSYVGNFVHGNHPLLQQHNSIETTEANSNNNSNNNSVDTNSDRQQEARLTARPAPRTSEGRSIGWSETAGSQVHSLALTDSEASYLAQLARGDEAPKVALISEQDLAKLLAGLQQQVQQAARQDGVVVLPDGQQSVAEISTDLMQASQQQQTTTTPEERHHQQRRAMTRSLRLMDFHHRQQLLAPARTNIQATTTTTTTTNLFGAEISFVSSLVFSSCIIILMLMSICIILSAIVIRNNLAAA